MGQAKNRTRSTSPDSSGGKGADLIDHSHRPSALLLWLEGRAIYDFAAMGPMFALNGLLPRGDGQPVLVLPGFLASSRTTGPLRQFIARLGYKAHRWKLGYNMGYSHRLHYGMRDGTGRSVRAESEPGGLESGWCLRPRTGS